MICQPPWLRRIVIGIASSVLVGCGYPEVSSDTYAYAKALYSITNRQADAELDQVSQQIEAAVEGGQLTQQEARWLQDIVAEARQGNWTSSNREARKLMEDQIR